MVTVDRNGVKILKNDTLRYVGSGFNEPDFDKLTYGDIVTAKYVDDDGTLTLHEVRDSNGFGYWFDAESFEHFEENWIDEDMFTGEEIAFF